MKLTTRDAIVYAGGLVLVVLVVWAFTLTGSPSHQRKLAEDRDTINRVECLACAAQTKQCKGKSYPKNKDRVMSWLKRKNYSCYNSSYNCSGSYSSRRSTYENMDGIEYSLNKQGKPIICGSFHFSEEEQKKLGKRNHLPNNLQGYKAGKHCFTLNLPPVCKK